MKKTRVVFARVKRLFLNPSKEWKVISDEKSTVPEIVLNFLLPLLLIGLVASYIGYGIVGSKQDMFGLAASSKLGYRYAFFYFFLHIVTVFLSTLVISFVAHFFEANTNLKRNFTYTAYSFAPTMAATLLLILPILSPLVYIAGFFNLILFLTGIGRMTNVPKSKKWGYFSAISAIAIFMFFAVSKILYRIILD